jgi:hypothetical protein
VSPLYTAMTRYVPGPLGAKAPDVALPATIGRFSDVATGVPVQVVSPGP